MRYSILLAMCFQIAPAALANPIHRWVDDQGVANYTNDPSNIPSNAKAEETSGDEIALITSPPSSPARAAASAPSSVSTGITPDERALENQWRAAFREAHARVAIFEVEVEIDKELLEQGGATFSRVGSHRWDTQRWTPHPGYLLVQVNLQRNLAELRRARADLDELERAASRESVPREWRQP
jgi:hypothetical protein